VSDLDRRLEDWIAEHRAGVLDPVFVGATHAGSMGAVWLVIGVAVAIALRRPLVFPLVLAAVVLANLSTTALKEAVDRPRPTGVDMLVSTPTSPSFPSGHAAMSAAAAVVLCAAVPRLAPMFVLLAATIAFSRVYVGVHYPSDVLAGAAVGVFVATALLLLGRALQRSQPDRPVSRAGVFVRNRYDTDEDEHGGSRAQHDEEDALGEASRKLDACCPAGREYDDSYTEDEDELSDRAGVPAEHGDRRTLRGRSRVPAHERR
jgi:undecaprenyl-diphosphatase